MSLTLCPHPVLAAAGRQHYDVEVEAGESLQEYLRRLNIAIPAHAPCWLTVGGRRVPAAMWRHFRPAPGQVITLRLGVEGGDGSNPLAVVATIALNVVAPGIGEAVAMSVMGSPMWATPMFAVVSAVATAGVNLIGGMVINSLFAPPSPNLDQRRLPDVSPTYSLSGGSNQPRPYSPLPLVLGRHRVFPDLSARPFNEFEGYDQYLLSTFNFGLGDLRITDLRIGDTPIDDYNGVTMQESGDDGVLTLFPGNVDTVAGGELTDTSTYITRTTSLDTVAIAFDAEAVLYWIDGNGNMNSASRPIEAEYRPVGTSTWLPFYPNRVSTATHYWSRGRMIAQTDVVDGVYVTSSVWSQVSYGSIVAGDHVEGDAAGTDSAGNALTWHWQDVATARTFAYALPPLDVVADSNSDGLTGNSPRPVRKTFRRDGLAPGQYEIRIRRSYPKIGSPVVDEMSVTAIRSYQQDTGDYTGQRRLGVKIKASGQISGTLARVSALVEHRVRLWDGSAWTLGFTRNPAWCFLAFAVGASDAAGRRLWGAGIPDARIDLDTLKLWAAFCDDNGLTFDAVVDSAMSCAEVLNGIARCGRASASWATGKLGVIWDAPGQPIVASFGMANILAGSFVVEYLSSQTVDEIVLHYINPDNGWQQDSVRVPADAIDPVRTQELQWWGCTDRAMAGQLANLLYAQSLYRRRRVTWETDAEGLVVTRGDVVALSHDLTQWGYSGRIVDATTSELTLDRAVPRTAGTPAWIALIAPDGSESIHALADAATGDHTTVTLATPLSAAPGADPAFSGVGPIEWKYRFDHQATPGKKVKIVALQPQAERRVKIVAVDEAPEFYAAADLGYVFEAPPGGRDTTAVAGSLAVAEELIRAGAGFAVRVHLTWGVTGSADVYRIRYRLSLGDWVTLPLQSARHAEIIVPESGLLDVEVTAINALGQQQPTPATLSYTLQGKAYPPPDVSTFTVQAQADGTRQFSWTLTSPPLDLAGFEIRYASGSASDYDAMTPLHTGVLTASPYELNQLAAGTYTFAIKAVDLSGNYSAGALFVTSLTLPDPRLADAVWSSDEWAEAWPGTATDCHADGATGWLVADETAASPWVRTWSGTWITTPASPIVYERVIDLGAITEFTPSATVTASGTATVTESHSDDGVTYSSYAALGARFSARYLKVRVSVSGAAPGLKGLFVVLTAQLRRETLADVATGSLTGAYRIATGHVRLPITGSYTAIKSVQVALQNVGAGWSWELLDKDTATGPAIKIYNGSGTLADATIDADIVGY